MPEDEPKQQQRKRKQKDLFAAHERDTDAGPPRKARTRDLARNLNVHLRVDADEDEEEQREQDAPPPAEEDASPPPEKAPRSTSVNLDFDDEEYGTATTALAPSPPSSHSSPPARPRSRMHSAPLPGHRGRSESKEVLSVSQVTGRLRRQVEALGEVWVAGEVSGLSRRGHLYFSLKDDEARLKCVMWASDAARLRFDVKDGLDVMVRGRLSVYEPHGQLQLYVSHIQPQGIGALQLAFEQLKQKLAAEGLFARERKRPLPFLPRRVGVVTSRHGAALRDVLKTIRSRYPSMPVLLADARVQGDAAAQEIVAAIRMMNRFAQQGGAVDVLLITRGGGSYEDLVAFNDEALARAIAASRIPTVSAVGHEVDTTIADFVADRRGTTPTDGARLCVPEQAELNRRVELTGRRLRAAMRHRIQAARAQAQSVQSRLERASPQARLRAVHHRLDVLGERMAAALTRRLGAAQSRLDRASEAMLHLDPARALLPRLRERLDANEQRLHRAVRLVVMRQREGLVAAAQRLEAYSPLKVLARGYSVTLSAQGHALLDAAEVKPGDEIQTRLHRGTLRSRITAVDEPAPPERADTDAAADAADADDNPSQTNPKPEATQ